MNDETTIALLRRALDDEAQGHRLDPGAAATALECADAARPPRRRRGYVAVAGALAGAAAVAGVYAVGATRPDTVHPAAAGCGPVLDAPLPVWARAGFTPPDQPVWHITSAGGQIVAVVFVDLRVHPPAGTSNKILWAARDGSGPGPLVIRASLPGRDGELTRTVAGGPGPSTVDLPVAGCWHLDLTWGRQHDTISVPYAP